MRAGWIGAGGRVVACRAGRAVLECLPVLIRPTTTDGRRFRFPPPLALLPSPDLLGIEAQVASSNVQHALGGIFAGLHFHTASAHPLITHSNPLRVVLYVNWLGDSRFPL
jgi:hypothetical protein